MSRYELLLFLHIAAAIIWLGAAFTLQALIFRAERANDPTAMKTTADSGEWLANRVFIPSSLAVLVVGILLTLDGPWGFDQLWILLGLAGYAFSFLIGILFFKPEGARIAAGIESAGPGSPDVARRIRRISAFSQLELVVLFLVVADMAIKPTADDVWTLVIGAAIVVAAAALTARTVRSDAAAVEATARP